MTESGGSGTPRPIRSIASYQVQRVGLFLACAVVIFLGALLVMWLADATPDDGAGYGNLAVIVAFAAALVSSVVSWFVLRGPREQVTEQMRAKAKQSHESGEAKRAANPARGKSRRKR